ncbi:MAG: PHP domain-containing protein [Gemmatimonadota bacterium]
MAETPLVAGRVGIIHVHSDYSHDGRDSLEKVSEFARERAIAFVGLTDHAEDMTPDVYREYKARCAALSDDSVALIPGLEYRFPGYPGLHLLALGLDRMIEPGTPEEFCSQASGLARFTIAAHPVLPQYQIPLSVGNSIDAIEVWNAAYNTRFLPDPRAIRLYHDLREHRPALVATTGLDQHDCRNDRETRVILDDPRATDPLAELKAGRFINRGRTMQFDSRASFSGAGLAALSTARWSLDLVNVMHERVMRARSR